MDHQHTRFDRDRYARTLVPVYSYSYRAHRYIRVNWEHIDPQSYDLFAVDSGTSSTYGIEYDYMSVLHYGPKVRG